MQLFAMAALLSSLTAGQVFPKPAETPTWSQFDQIGTNGNYKGASAGHWPRWPLMPAPSPLAPRPSATGPQGNWPQTGAKRLPNKFYGPGGVRQDISNLDPNGTTLQSFRKAIEAMRRLPADDPHSLVFQANIHGFPATSNPNPDWGQCQHGNWWFLPWHRAYLVHLERIMRRYAEDPSFCIPFWDYSNPQARALPVPFRDPGSPLYDGSRRASVNSGGDQLDPAIVVTGTNATMTSTVFADFGPVVTFGGRAVDAPEQMGIPHGALESSPHDAVHAFVGGNLGNVDMAGRDPAFLVHHANIDRLWVQWLQQGGGRANPTDEAFLNQQFNFYDETKNRVTIRVRDVLDTAALGYTYERLGSPPATPGTPAPTTPAEPIATVNTSGQPLGNRPITVTLSLTDTGRGRLQRNLAASRQFLPATANQAHLRLDGVKFSGPPDSAVAVYLNMPKNQKPDPRSPYYVGCFTFFGQGHHTAKESYLDVTKQLQRVWPYGNGRDLTVTLVRVSPGVLPMEFRTSCTSSQLALAVAK